MITFAALAGEASWDELNNKVKALQSEKKYTDAIKTYEELLQLTQKNYGEKNVKVAKILIEMSLIQQYDLNNEKKYNELQGRAKKIMMTLNGKLNCRGNCLAAARAMQLKIMERELSQLAAHSPDCMTWDVPVACRSGHALRIETIRACRLETLPVKGSP